ncbi:MAG: UbiD family decarboxylase [Candidatus Tectomicrobia bacterium]|nr:UbiD family decarboxylase [Candidatus Tectomicrobia bacterium]
MKDLRSFLEDLEERAPEEVFRVRREVDPEFGPVAIARKLQAENRWPVVYCEKVKGSRFPIVSSRLVDTLRKQSIAFATPEAKLRDEIVRRLAAPIPPRIVESGPIKDVILKGDDIDIGMLPIVKHAELDAAPYITAGITTVKNPETGKQNCGVYRLMYKGEKRRLGFFFLGDSIETKHIYYLREQADEPMEVAVFLGHHPAVFMGSVFAGPSSAPTGICNEYGLIGGLLQEPLEVVKCETVDLYVPAYAEIVIEGVVPPHHREPEAPFGEYHKYYGLQRQSPVLEITAITHRRDARYQNIPMADIRLPRGPIDLRPIALYQKVKELIPQLLDVRFLNVGMAVLKIRTEFDGLAKQAGLAALGAAFRPTYVIVVDEDIDIHNTDEVLWAVATRTKPSLDFCFINDVYTNVLEVSGYTIRSRAEPNGLNTKVLIDATKTVEAPFPARAEVPRRLWENLDLEALSEP